MDRNKCAQEATTFTGRGAATEGNNRRYLNQARNVAALFLIKGEDASMSEHVGQQFGNYRLVRRLGKGGFGQVYLGEHIYLKTHAAIKLLLKEVDGVQGEAFQTAFLQEARRIAALKHPHI